MFSTDHFNMMKIVGKPMRRSGMQSTVFTWRKIVIQIPVLPWQFTAHAYMARRLISYITLINNLGKLSQQDLVKSGEDYKLPSNIGIWLSQEENSS